MGRKTDTGGPLRRFGTSRQPWRSPADLTSSTEPVRLHHPSRRATVAASCRSKKLTKPDVNTRRRALPPSNDESPNPRRQCLTHASPNQTRSARRRNLVLPCATLSQNCSSRDLLDANESTWAFVAVDRVGCLNNEQVKRLATLARVGVCWNYCGRIADGTIRPASRERERALVVRGAAQIATGTPTPSWSSTAAASALHGGNGSLG